MKGLAVPSLIVGFLAGSVIVGGLMLAIRRADDRRSPSPTVPAPTPEAPGPDLAAENEQLKKRVAVLEKLSAEAPQNPEPERPVPAVPAPALKKDFDELAAMGMMGAQGAKAAAFLEKIKKDRETGIRFLLDTVRHGKTTSERFLAAAFLEGLKDPDAVPELAGLLAGEKDMLVRRMISHAIAVIGGESGQGALRTAMTSDADWGVRVNSAYGLAKQGQADGRTYLEEAYVSGDTPAEYRLAILGGLADVAAPETAPVFRGILRDTKDAGYLLMAISALGKMKDGASIGSLEQVAVSDVPDSVKEAARKAIEEIRKP